jgi:hypothetical protein
MKKIFDIHSKKLLEPIVYFSLLLIYFIVTVGDLNLTLSHTSTDDGIIAHAISFTNPKIFSNDIQANSFRIETFSSLMNSIPALGLKFLHINPIFFWITFLLIQTILLPIAIYGIFKILSNDKYMSLLATIIFINIRPQTRNLSASGDLDWMPYAMWLSENILVFAILMHLKRNKVQAFILVVISCLIHPSMGLWAIIFFIIGDYLISKKNSYSFKLPTISLLIYGAFLAINFIYIDQVTYKNVESEYINSVLNNGHFSSISIFNNDFEIYKIVNASLIVLASISIYLIFERQNNMVKHKEYWFFVKAAYFIAILGVTFQIIALSAKEINMVRFLGTRFTSVLAILIFVVFIIHVLDNYRNSKIDKCLFITFLFFPGALVLFLYGAWSVYKNWSKVNLKSKFLCLILLGLMVVSSARLFLSYLTILQKPESISLVVLIEDSNLFFRNFFLNAVPITVHILLYLLFVVLLFSNSFITSRVFSKLQIQGSHKYFSFLLILLLLIGKNHFTANRFSERDQKFMHVQEWARSYSQHDDLFLVLVDTTYNGWRNYSNRPKLSLGFPSSPYGVYDENIFVWKKVEQILKNHPNEDLKEPSIGLLADLNKDFGLDYLVTPVDFQNYNYKLVYSNSDFFVYKL